MKKTLGIILTTCLILVGGGIAVASIPDGSGVIHGCYMNSTGRLKVIDSATQTCGTGETALNWSQTGPQGATGATGATGAAGSTGATGPQGPAGEVSDVEVVYADGQVTLTTGVPWGFMRVDCPEGKFVLGGGGGLRDTAVALGSHPELAVFSSIPVGAAPPGPMTGWRVDVTDAAVSSSYSVTLTAYAICAVA